MVKAIDTGTTEWSRQWTQVRLNGEGSGHRYDWLGQWTQVWLNGEGSGHKCG